MVALAGLVLGAMIPGPPDDGRSAPPAVRGLKPGDGSLTSSFKIAAGCFTSSLFLVYISLPPGAIPNGITATIRDFRNGGSTTAHVVNGGFDPAALPAIEGDTLAITVRADRGRRLTFNQCSSRPSSGRSLSAPARRRTSGMCPSILSS